MIVLVTGARTGFGRRIAVAAARAGHQVYAGLHDLARGISDPPADLAALPITPIQLDVCDAGERAAAIAEIRARSGRLDALINNAGVAVGGFLEQLSEAEVRRQFEVNVLAVWALTREVQPMLREQRGGIVINVSSMAGRMTLPGLGIYGASKFALEGMTEALRHEMRPFGVRVVLVEPGPYATEIFDPRRPVGADDEAAEDPYAPLRTRIERLFAGVKMGDPQEVADLVVSILADPRPRLRYPLGPGVFARLWMRRLLPFEIQEKVIARVLGF